MTTILVTGITGTVMNPLCARLLEEGHTIVALVRPSKEASPVERLSHTIDVSEQARRNLFVLPGDITQELGGVAPEELGRWHGKIEKVLHGAASIKFVETADNQVFNTNVCGTEHMLHLAEELGIPEFHHISTAYVCGDAEYFDEDDSGEKQHHRNAYEKSKACAERLVREFPRRFSIHRIPIVVGDSQTGKISSFSGYYGFLAPFWQLSQSLHRRWKENPAELRKQGITMDGEGYLHVPLSVPCSQEGPLNLVPLDWLAEMLVEAVQQPAEGKVFHLTHPNPRGVRETMIASLAHLGFRGVTCGAEPQKNHHNFVSRIQRGIIASIEPYVPYISKNREVFHNDTTMRAIGPKWIPPPDINSEVVGRLLAFAKAHNFARS